MRKSIYNILIAFFGGILISSLLFILFRIVPKAISPIVYSLLVISIIEESSKFLLIKKGIGLFPYGFFLGFGFAVGENILKYPFWEYGAVFEKRIPGILIHIITAGIICYFVKKGKPFLGLLIAIFIHTIFNFLCVVSTK